jgi:hypothetical protein
MVAGDACEGETPAAWMTPVNVPERRGGLGEIVNRLARRHIDGRGADLESGILQHLGRRRGILFSQISQEDAFSGADPSRDRLTNRPCPDDDDDVAH